MAYEQPGFKIGTFVASEDLSSQKFKVVVLTTTAKLAVPTSATGSNIGVLQNNPTSSGEANVMVNGITKVSAGGAFSTAQRLQVNATGSLIAVTSATAALGNNVGIALEASAQAGDIVACLINFGNL